MAVRVADPWGDKSSFENMSKQAGGMVKKVVSNTVKAVVSDVKEQLGIETNTSQQTGQASQPKPVDPSQSLEQLQQAEQQKQKILNETRANLQKINQDIMKVRRERQQNEQQKVKQEKEVKQEKKVEEQKKNAEPFWKTMLKGRTGAREGAKKQGS